MRDISHRVRKINRTNPDRYAAGAQANTAERPEAWVARLWSRVKTQPAISTLAISNDFEWAVAAFAVGIVLYFIAPFEPAWLILASIAAVLMGGYGIVQRKDMTGRWALAVFLLSAMSIGAMRASWHTDRVATPDISERAYWVTGWVEAVETSKSGARWRIRVTDFKGYGDPPKPHRVRVTVRKGEAYGGDSVRMRAVLRPLPGPVVPGGYDPGRKAYFDRIAASGYNITTPDVIADLPLPPLEAAQRKLAKIRYGLARRINRAAPEATAGLQVALLTGVRSYIPEAQVEALRVAGLAHVLAISGLHMGLLSGGAFYLATFLLALIIPLSRRYDVRKPAAVIGAAVATAYLALSGASVATQRAFIMVMIVYLAIILDRRAFSMRSVAVAALVTLGLHPEALISAGFQMSFAAVAALVVVYQHWQGGRRNYAQGLWGRMKAGLLTLSVTSLVAGAATGGFAVMHFGRVARYGFLGNLLAMPIFSIFVMPAALATLILMPFGYEAAPLYVMGMSLSAVLWVADNVASWPGALGHIKGAPPWLIGIYSAGFLALILGRLRLRLAGLAVIAVCGVIWAVEPRADLRISDTGRIAFWDVGTASETGEPDETFSAETPALYVSSKRSDRYGRDRFIGRAGVASAQPQSYQNGRADCDALACRFQIKDRWISVIHHPSEVVEACAQSDLVILTKRRAGPVARRGCQAIIVDEQDFRRNGAQDVFVNANGIRARSALSVKRRNRPWGD